MDGKCIVCNEFCTSYCDNCGAYICFLHSHKPFATKNIILCDACWGKRDKILDKFRDPLF